MKFVIVHSRPGPGFGQVVIEAQAVGDTPPNSVREEIEAVDQAAAEAEAALKYADLPGVTKVFPAAGGN